MKKVKCSKGHWYDADQFASCPHCADIEAEKKKEERASENEKSEEQVRTSDSVIIDLLDSAKGAETVHEDEEDHDDLIFKGLLDDLQGEQQKDRAEEDQRTEVSSLDSLSWINSEEKSLKEEEKYVPDSDADSEAIMLNLSAEYSNERQNMRPVAGWLVCIRGADYGKAYEVKIGNNRIGRSAEMDINISEDKFVSRNVQAIISCESLNGEYTFSVGDSVRPIFVNGDEIVDSVILNADDRVVIGKSVFIFVPLKIDGFSWE